MLLKTRYPCLWAIVPDLRGNRAKLRKFQPTVDQIAKDYERAQSGGSFNLIHATSPNAIGMRSERLLIVKKGLAPNVLHVYKS